jgi:hypothetical protein
MRIDVEVKGLPEVIAAFAEVQGGVVAKGAGGAIGAAGTLARLTARSIAGVLATAGGLIAAVLSLSKADVTLSDAAVTALTLADTAVTALSLTDGVATALTLADAVATTLVLADSAVTTLALGDSTT